MTGAEAAGPVARLVVRDHGAGIPACFNDRLGTEYLLDRGASWDDARDWAMAGCIIPK